MSENQIQVYTIYINASAQKVWDAITTSEGSNQWGYGGDVEYDLTPGGSFRNLTTPSMRQMGLGEVAVSGTVVESEPGKRLVLDWLPAWHPETAPTRITWELTEFDGPLTKLVFTHDLTASPNYAGEVAGGNDPHQGGGGWPWTLAGLKTYVETGSAMVGSGAN